MPHDDATLARFVDAQAGVIDTVRAELRAGRKRSHWMWFVFPQLRGLGHSEMAWRYGLASLDEARAYAAHPLLGARLQDCTALMLAHAGQAVRDILGRPDDLKFQSCMTLFAQADPGQPLYRRALDAFFGGQPDAGTLRLLRQPAHGAAAAGKAGRDDGDR